MTAKAVAADALAKLPDDVSFDEIIERLYLIRKIQIGIAQADAGDVIDHEEVKRRFLGRSP
jgi:hypothetical protein